MEVADEAVDGGFAHVLHHHDVGEGAAEAVVVAVGEVVFGHEVGGGAAEEYGVAVFIVPAGITSRSKVSDDNAPDWANGSPALLMRMFSMALAVYHWSSRSKPDGTMLSV